MSDAKKAAIDATLVAKLSNELATEFKSGTYAVTPSDNEYVFEAVKGGTGYGYEISNHMVSGEIPQTFILVNTSDGATSWTPNGKYAYGESNYEVTYCCDVETPLAYATDYKRINLEDSNYYGKLASEHIRAILQNSYPYVTLEEMKEGLGDDMYLIDGIPAIYFDETYPEEVLVDCVHKILDMFAPNLVLGISDEISSTGDIERIRLVGKIVDEYNAKFE